MKMEHDFHKIDREGKSSNLGEELLDWWLLKGRKKGCEDNS